MAAHPDLDGIPVIVLSSLPEEAARARTKGAAAIVRKPYTADEVLDVIARVIGRAGEAGT
jgi:CheY-like chemotaxis protein